MSSLLAFAWRRRRWNEERDDESLQMLPAIASYSSSDTLSITMEKKTEYICIPRRKSVLVTPEGLKPRLSIGELRSQLLGDDELPEEVKTNLNENEEFKNFVPVQSSTALVPVQESKQNDATHNVWKDHQTKLPMILPPVPSRSWSTAPMEFSSPTPSSSGWTAAPSAESPHLVPGLARTAVGNLVALQDPPGVTPTKTSTPYNETWNYSPEENRVEAMFSPVISLRSSRRSQKLPSSTQATLGTKSMFSPVLSSNSVTSVSTIPAPSPLIPSSRLATDKSTDVVLTASEWKMIASVEDHQQNVIQPGMDADMQRIKARNQQRAKEELILEVLERLQDETMLVADVEGLMGPDWCVSTPLDQEGLLTGITDERRQRIIEKLDLLLNELNSAVATEEFFFSPSKADISEYEDESSHNDLHAALAFCKILVQMAVPSHEKDDHSLQGTTEPGRWRFLPGLREAIGVLPSQPESSDSSFFSLPPDESGALTPMTSNLSLGASTLTTRPHESLKKKTKQENGLLLRQAIQLYSTGLQKMTDACKSLGSMSSWKAAELIVLAETIKKTYFQMLDISQRDLKSMVDAFEFELEESYEIEDDRSSSPVMRAETIGSGRITDVSLLGNEIDTSFEANFLEFDDLRREVGSIDYGDDSEERDDPEEEPSSVRSWTSRRGKRVDVDV